MVDQNLPNIRALVRQPVSSAIRDILRDCRPDGTVDEIDVYSFLLATLIKDSRPGQSTHVLPPSPSGTPSDDRPELPPGRNIEDYAVSAGLAAAFEEAHLIRSRTGGKDPFIGLRHVLFAIATATEPPLGAEAMEAFARLELDRPKAIEAVVSLIARNKESQEDPEVWNDIFAARGTGKRLRVPTHVSPPPRAAGPGKKRGPARPRAEPRPAPPIVPGVAISRADDPWAPGLEDRSGAGREAKAFAEMVTASNFDPPLAVGVFGDWGSGKSFFMRLVHDAVETVKARPAPNKRKQGSKGAKQPEPSPGRVIFLKDVVQIRFNAWHYVETNLWASLVDHIFTSLDRWGGRKEGAVDEVLERLSTARQLTLEAAESLVERRCELREAAQQQQAQKAELEKARANAETSPLTLARAAWKTVSARPEIQRRRDQAARRLGLPQLRDNVEGFQASRAAMSGPARAALRRGAMLQGALSLRGLLVAAVALSLAWAAARYAGGLDRIQGAFAAVGAFVLPIAAGIGWLSRQINGALAGLASVGAAFDQAVAEKTAKQAATAAAASEKVATAQAKSVEAEERFRVAREQVAAASRDYHNQSGRGRVMHFIQERVASGDYARQLGFVATVRRDFEELSALMSPSSTLTDEAEKARKAHQKRVDALIARVGGDLLSPDEKGKLEGTKAVAGPATPIFERIILYVDDLDRCPPTKVIQVLQAIHLLLAFPLFVVFVAVDVRWLRHALTTEYSGQIARAGEAGMATPGDYLEKIFQLPYWVRPLAGQNTVSILDDHLKGDEEAPLPVPQAPHAGKPQSKPKPAERAADGKAEAQAAAESGKGSEAAVATDVSRLRISRDEAAFIKRLGPVLDGSPRRTLRFVNTYRVIKASLTQEQLQSLAQRGHRGALALLAISVAADSILPFLAATLEKNSRFGTVWIDRIPAASADARDRKRAKEILKVLRPTAADREAMRTFLPIVERFSFQPELAGLSLSS